MKNNYDKILESYLIPAEEGLFSNIFKKFRKKSSVTPKSELKADLKKKYAEMTDEQIASRMIDGIRKSGYKIYDENDENTKKAVEMTTMVSSNYKKFNFNGALVLVTYDKKTIFSIWGNIRGYRDHACISTEKNELIKSLIEEELASAM